MDRWMDWWIIARDTSVSTYLPTCHLPRLDTSLKKYNEAVARNKRLRESIDGLRRERLVFDQIYAKLEREMAEKKREMARIAEASNRASLALSSFTIPTFTPPPPPAPPSPSPGAHHRGLEQGVRGARRSAARDGRPQGAGTARPRPPCGPCGPCGRHACSPC